MRIVISNFIRSILESFKKRDIPKSIKHIDDLDVLVVFANFSLNSDQIEEIINFFQAKNTLMPCPLLQGIPDQSIELLLSFPQKTDEEKDFICSFSLYCYIQWLSITDVRDMEKYAKPLVSLCFKCMNETRYGETLFAVLKSIALNLVFTKNKNLISNCASVFASSNERGEKLLNYFMFVDRFRSAFGSAINYDYIAALTSYIPQFLSSFSIQSLDIFDFVKEYVPAEAVNVLVASILTPFCKNAQKSVAFIKNEQILPKNIFPKGINPQILLGFREQKLFQHGIDFSKNVPYSDVWDFSDLIDDLSFTYFDALCKIGKHNVNVLNAITMFILGMFDMQGWSQRDLFPVILSIILLSNCKISSNWATPFVTKVVLWIFGSTNTERMQDLFFTALSKNGFDDLYVVIEAMTHSPYYTGEIIKKVITVFPLIPDNALISMSKPLANLALNFQSWSFLCEPEVLPFFEQIRLDILSFTCQILLQSEVQVVSCCLSNPTFRSVFFSYFFEDNIRETVMKTFKLILFRDGVDKYESISMFCYVVKVCISQLPKNGSVEICTELINFSVDVISNKKNLADDFAALIPSLCLMMNELDASESSVKLVELALHFFSLMKRKFLKSEISDQLATNIKRIYNENYSENLLNELIQLCSGQNMFIRTPSFSISHPLALVEMIDIYGSTDQFSDIINFISELLDFCNFNCALAQEGGVDVALIKSISRFRDDPGKMEIINFIIDTAFKIAFVASSPFFIYELIKLFKPINGRLCKNHYEILRKFTEKVIEQKSKPLIFLPIFTGTPKVVIKNVKMSIYFLVHMWLYIDTTKPNTDVTLLRAEDESVVINIQLSGCVINVTYSTKRFDGKARFDREIPAKKWFLMTIYMQDQNGFPVINLSVNGNDPFFFETRMTEFTGKKTKITVLYTDSPVLSEDQCYVHVANFALSYMPKTTISVNEIIALGPKEDLSKFVDPIASFSFRKDRGYLSLGRVNSKFGADISLEGQRLIFRETILDTLVSTIDSDIFLPLFSQLSIPSDSSVPCDSLCCMIIDIYSSAFQLSKSLQESFSRIKKVDLLIDIFNQVPVEALTYTTYLRIYNLLYIITHVPLQKQIVRGLLANFKIISRIGPESQLKIIHHIRNHLFREFPEFFFDAFYFRNLLSYIRFFYYYEKHDSEENQVEGLNVAEIRFVLFDLLEQVAKKKLDKRDILLLVCTTITCQDKEQIPEFIGFLSNLINRMQQNADMSIFSYVNFLGMCHFAETELSIFNIFVSLTARKQILSFSLFRNTKNEMIKKETKRLLMSGCNQMFQLYVFLHKDGEDLDWLTPGALSIATNRLYFAFMVINASEETRERLLTFSHANLKPKEFMRALICASWICRVDVSSIVVPYFKSELDSADKYETLKIIKLGIIYLFNRGEKIHTNTLISLMQEKGMFNEEEYDEKVDYDPGTVIDKLNKILEFKGTFGIRIEDGKWVDEEFALLLLKKIEGMITAKLYQPYFLILGVMKKERHEFAGNPEILDRIMNDSNPKEANIMIDFSSNISNFVDVCKPKFMTKFAQAIINESPKLLKSSTIDTYSKRVVSMENLFSLSYWILRSQRGSKKWHEAWKNISCEKAPWEHRVEHVYWKRDTTLTSKMFPIIFVRDWTHTDHHESNVDGERKMVGLPDKKYIVRSALFGFDQEKIIHEQSCVLVRPKMNKPAYFIAGARSFFVFKHGKTFDKYRMKQIIYIYKRNFGGRPVGLEFIFDFGISIFLSFFPTTSDEIMAKLRPHMPRLKAYITPENADPSAAMDDWVHHRISTFEYLITLNYLSGRSFNDLTQYPIFPWIIDDYQSSELNLKSSSTFRNLSKVVQKLCPACGDEASPCYYSRQLTSAGFLVRIEPITRHFIELNGNSLETKEKKVFSSIERTYGQIHKNPVDLRELIPEFFFSPEFLESSKDSLAIETSNVILPKWASDAFDFVYKNRQALESEYVDANLPAWIDQIFGVDQRKAAKFVPFVYNEGWTQEMSNSIALGRDYCKKIMNRGIIPNQIFRQKHPLRMPLSTCAKETISLVKTGVMNVIYAYFFNDGKTLKSFILTPGGVVRSVSYKFEETFSLKSVAVSADYKDIDPNFKLCERVDSETFCITKKNSHVLSVCDCNGNWLRNVVLVSGNVIALSAGSGFICTALSDSIIYLWDKRSLVSPSKSLRSFIGQPTCVFFSEEIGVIVVGVPKMIEVIKIADMSVLRVIEMEIDPTKIVVTPTFGLICVFGEFTMNGMKKKALNVFTVNGKLLSKAIDVGRVVCGCGFEKDGIDYIAFADDRNRIFIENPLNVMMKSQKYDAHSAAVTMQFVRKRRTLCICTEDGDIVLITL